MTIVLLTVGKTDVPWVREGLELYASRLAHYIPFSVTEIPELNLEEAASKVVNDRNTVFFRITERHSGEAADPVPDSNGRAVKLTGKKKC